MKNCLISCIRFLEALFCCRRQENGFIGFQENVSNTKKENGFIGFQTNVSNTEKGTVKKRTKNHTSSIDSSRQAVFQNIYYKRLWGKGGKGSGPGSTVNYTVILRKHLLEFISLYNISSMADFPCGGMVWTEVFLKSVWEEKPYFTYIGMDITESVVKELQEKWKSNNRVAIQVADLASFLPNIKADFTLTRDALQHMSWKDSCLAINNLINLGDNVKYILIGTYPKSIRNYDIKTGGYYSINVMKNPFNLPEPHFIFQERSENTHQKYIYAFKMTDLQNHKCKICNLYFKRNECQ
ncbi:hypothetical protein KUTeg_022792 [Tegillarca granosa]|uniref:Methyltransferase domain-containing protein n=1 Tax=Tegillarca granosa TaxID=220873 RepID=A0ABQ9E0F6_TEGGR|nr:hypothetical protein KUTeg_022792 [Tegillarca granosa]